MQGSTKNQMHHQGGNAKPTGHHTAYLFPTAEWTGLRYITTVWQKIRDVIKPAKICIPWMQISC